MTPEQHLADVQTRLDDFVDYILTCGPPSGPWTTGDAQAVLAPGYDIAAEMVDALVASAKVSRDEASAVDFKRRAAALPAQFGFFAETIIAHWRRHENKGPKPSPLDLGNKPTKRTFVNTLLDKGIISEEQLKQAREVQKQVPGDIAEILRDLDFAGEQEIASARAAALGLQFVDFSRLNADPEAVARVPEHIIRRYNILPIRLDKTSHPNKLMVAVGDIQTSMAGLDDVRLASRCQITPVLAAPSDLRKAIDRAFPKPPQD